MRHAQRNGAREGNGARTEGLHLKGEPDNFYSSHGCLLTRRLWLGARSVFKHRRVPFTYYSCFASCDRLCPNSARPCTSWLSLYRPRPKDELAFRPELEWEVLQSASLESIGERFPKQFREAGPPVSSNTSS